MALFLSFLFGIGNFAMHKAVLESRHPLLGQMPWFVHLLGGPVTLVTEFIVLLAALLLIGSGSPNWVLAYAAYTVINGFGAWLILTRRI